MKTSSFLLFLLPIAAFGQTVGARVSAILAEGVQNGAQGLYLKQVNGPLLAVQQDRYIFDPQNAVSVIPLLFAMEGVRVGSFTLDTPITRYTNAPTSCPNPPVLGGTEPLSTALREMMWHSDNARTHAVQSGFVRADVDRFSNALGLRSTTQPQIPGCQTPGRSTLAELGALWEAIAVGALPTFARQSFLGLLAGKAQALVESTDYDHLWDTDIPKIMRQEAPQGMTQAQMTQFQNSMDLGYKSGGVVKCREVSCGEVLEDRAIVGLAKIPFCSSGLTVSREYVFGVFVSGALDTSWTPGKVTVAERQFTAARAELLRELIRDGMASCYGGDAVMVSPAPNSTLTGRTVVFAWSSAADVRGYRLDIGTAPAGTQLGTIFTSNTSAVVTNLPCNGSTIYARLWTQKEQYGNPKDYAFRACSNAGPTITSPAPGTTLTSPSVTFTWTAVTDADFYRISIGSALGGNDLDAAGPPTNTYTINTLPTDGRVIFVRIQAHTPAGYGPISDFAYNNLAGSGPAVTSVVNAATLRANLSPACLAVLTGANYSADVILTVSGIRAQIVGSPTNTQITFVVPPTSGTGPKTVVIASGGVASVPFPIVLADASPGLYLPLLDSAGAPLAAGRSLKPGDVLMARAVGLGPLGADGRPVLGVRVRVGGIQGSVTSVAPVALSPGVVQLTFAIPSNAPSGSQPIVVEVGSGASDPVRVTIAGPAIGGILNGASFATGARVAPGSLIALFGTDLATEDGFGLYPSALLPGSGVVTINGVSAPLFDVVASAGQINLLVPFETPVDRNVAVVVTNALGTSAAFPLAIAPVAPGIFRIVDPSLTTRRNAAALVANTAWRVLPSSMAAALGMPQDCKANRVNPAAICGEPAAAGDPIQIYVTGLGRATPNGNPAGSTLRTGDVAPANGSVLYRTVDTPRVTIGGIDAAVAFSGIAPGFAGLYQINVTIPPGVAGGDDVPVTIEIGGVSDTATIAIRP